MTAQDLLHVRAGSVSSPCRVKRYPDGSLELLACSESVFRPDGWEAARKRAKGKKRSPNGDESCSPGSEPESLERSMRRARAQVRDLALCSGFKYFVTLTLNREKVDRYDMAEITKKLNHWLDNQVRRKGLAYVLVPERHQDGAIHFHGFFNDALEVVDSGHKDCKGHVIYNLPGWSLGFTTAIELYGDYAAAVGYVCKYIGKQGEKPGGRWYYSGGQLGRPDVSYADISLRELEAMPGAYSFSPEGSGLSFVLVRVAPQEEKVNQIHEEVNQIQEEREENHGICRETERGQHPVGGAVDGAGEGAKMLVRRSALPGAGGGRHPGRRGGGGSGACAAGGEGGGASCAGILPYLTSPA